MYEILTDSLASDAWWSSTFGKTCVRWRYQRTDFFKLLRRCHFVRAVVRFFRYNAMHAAACSKLYQHHASEKSKTCSSSVRYVNDVTAEYQRHRALTAKEAPWMRPSPCLEDLVLSIFVSLPTLRYVHFNTSILINLQYSVAYIGFFWG